MNPIEELLFKNSGFSRKEIKELKRQRYIRALEDYVLRKVAIEQELKKANPPEIKLFIIYLLYNGTEEEIDRYLDKPNICPTCRKEIDYSRKSIYCSDKCRNRASYLRSKEIKVTLYNES